MVNVRHIPAVHRASCFTVCSEHIRVNILGLYIAIFAGLLQIISKWYVHLKTMSIYLRKILW